MNRIHHPICFAALFGLVAPLQSLGAGIIFPGIIASPSPEPLEGRLVMLVANSPATGSSNTAPAAIYAFDVRQRSLKQVSTAPQFGHLDVSPDGHTFCVRAAEPSPEHAAAFVYSERTRSVHALPLSAPVTTDAVTEGHVLFALTRTNGPCLIAHELATGKQKVVAPPAATGWERQQIAESRVAREHPNLVYFTYTAETSGNGPSHICTNCCYSYDCETGKTEFLTPQATLPSERTEDGRYIFFIGPEGPSQGIELVSSPLDYPALAAADAKAKGQLRRIQRFPQPRQPSYRLLQLSPCRKYALLRLDELAPIGVYVHNYVVVNLSTSRTWTLLRDESQVQNGPRLCSQIYWVPGSNGPRTQS